MICAMMSIPVMEWIPMRRQSEELTAVLAEIRSMGGQIDRVKRCKHWIVYWSLDEKKLVQTVAVSGCAVGQRSAVARVRRLARAS
jgi:hypothetical protein